MGLSHLSAAEVAAWVVASCAAQGLPVKVSDPGVVRRVGALLGAPGAGSRAHPRSGSTRPDAGRSVAPHDADPGRGNGLGTWRPGADDDVVDHGPDDGVLSVEVQAAPGAA